MALFDNFWKPMYVFDVLCATFCLLSILLWTRRRWILSFLAFWLAYKAKELAVMLPLVLLCYELWFGPRRWKPLVPFFAVSLSFGIQGLLLNPNRDNEYTFRFTLRALSVTLAFYSSRVFLVPFLGFALLPGAILARNQRASFGLIIMGLFFVPLLVLPGRLFSAYCYLPFTGLAVAFAGLAEVCRPLRLAVFFLIWLPMDYRALRPQSRELRTQGDEVRAWVGTLASYARAAPPADIFLYQGTPGGYHSWGIEGAVKYLFRRTDLTVLPLEDPEAPKQLASRRVTLLGWNSALHKLGIAELTPGTGGTSYIDMSGAVPPWQLEAGWYGLEASYRWIAPTAVARLERPEGARQFELRVLVASAPLQESGATEVRVALNDRELEPRRFTESG